MYSFDMLHLVNKRSSMAAVDTATELLILHDPHRQVAYRHQSAQNCRWAGANSGCASPSIVLGRRDSVLFQETLVSQAKATVN